ncbi:MAG TPA: type II secretion system secretin GspD [Caldimonas sp.]|jgi:general secretion pathway protein D|nr:type II secretion system secretin GspD [Caldimonas sp.]HEX4233339.1 type II secretion system secretin GspD [Caldimonas sp.]
MTMQRTCASRATWLRKSGATAVAAALVVGSLPMPGAVAQTTPSAARFRGEPVTLNFVNADIEGVARAMSAILRQQFIVDPRVRGTITLYSEQPLTPREAYFNFLAALRGLGFTVVEVNGLFKVVPEADAKLQTGTVSVGEPGRRGDQIMTQIFRLDHENANNLVPVLRPLISPNNTINANPGNNTLVITDYADNLQRIGKIIAAMDTPASGDVEVIPLKYAVASDVAPLIQRLGEGGIGGQAPVPGAAAAGALATPTILVDGRSNSLIVRSPNPAKMASIRSLIAKLDLPPQGSATTGNIWVVHLKNADSTKLATVLRAAFSATGSGGGGGGGGGGSPGAAGGTSTSTQNLGANPAGTTGTGGLSSAATTPITPSAGPSTGGFIQADPATNSLIITAPEPLYRQVRLMIDQLDERRAQVYIESLIVEVTGDNAADFGFQWQGLLAAPNNQNAIVAGTNFGTTGNLLAITQAALAPSVNPTTTTGSTTSGISLGEGLNIGLLHNYFGTIGLAAIARMLQSQANTNIASTPNLVTLDNEEAKIVVGSNVPFVTGQFTNTGGTAISNPFQTIERKDVGITLRIRPQIGENGTIRMTIFQEASSLSDQVAPGTSNAGPSTNKRSIESNVVVDDGQIIVLGGLIEDRYSENKSKVPLLGDIPYLGALFRSESRTKTRTNLMVFLRPVVMRDAETANRISLDRYEQIRGFQREMQPTPSVLVPINDSPVIAPLRHVEQGTGQLSAPQTSPGTAKPLGVQPQVETAPAAPVVVPVIVPAAPAASAVAPAPPASSPGG